MSLVTAERVERPLSLFGPDPARSAEPVEHEAGWHDEGLGGGLTLDDAIVGAWEGLAAQAVVPCPLCGGPLEPHAHDVPGGRCGDCGTTLG